ncbi:hypothetical protein BZA05DRAFT_201918 [Tricharina praecox]|uniref:uncharacterized protein n=1 Tax=Tricharina praecox TaxID=43433 RepID=UPI0022205A67|nr:uncharacterized protein BZA05DRAFT_201918 [Tricharina praecox]KAI5856473.1 hypothetical protein BZA05DRAFT_201918 [Tricharina praecox]
MMTSPLMRSLASASASLRSFSRRAPPPLLLFRRCQWTAKRSLLTQSCYDGPTTPPLLHQTVGQHLIDTVREHGDRTAVISRHQSTRLSYHELLGQSLTLAAGLRRQGVVRGARVCVSLGNGIEFAVITCWLP